MTLKEKFEKYVLEKDFFGDNVQEKYTNGCEKIADEYAIDFYNWMRKNDTPENAEMWFGYSDQDMLNEFKKEKGLC